MITNTTNDVAILLISAGIKSVVTLPDMTVYLPGETTFTNHEGEVEEESQPAVYQISNGYVKEAELSEQPVFVVKGEAGQPDKLFNFVTRQYGWFNSELTGIDWE